DSSYVKKMVLIVGDQVPLHLRWIHSSVRLRNVDHRKLQIRKDVHRHSNQRENRTKCDPDDRNNYRDRPPHREINQPHAYSFLRTGALAAACKNAFRSPRTLAGARRARQTPSLATESSISA